MADKITDYAVNSARWLSLKDFEGEVWKDVSLCKGYMVSNYGRIKSVARKIPCKGKSGVNSYVVVREKIKMYGNNGKGYMNVCLCQDNKNVMEYVHRIVALAFIPNPLKLPHINHRDENKQNNCVSNLEWCTPVYNNNFGTARIRIKQTRRGNGNVRQVDMYDLEGNFLKHYDCAFDMEKDGISRREAYNVCKGRLRSYKGCVFRFSWEPFTYRDIDKFPKGAKKEVIKTDLDGNVIKTYPSIKSAERENGLSRNYLYSATYGSTRAALVNGEYFYIRKY